MLVELASGTPVHLVSVENPVGSLVIAPDIGGLRPLFAEMAVSIAESRRWNVVAVEPFPGRTFVEGDIDARLSAIRDIHELRAVADLVAAADLVAFTDPSTTGNGPVGLVGFCMGGMYVHKAAVTGRFERAVSFYGMIEMPDDWKGPGQTEPLAALEGSGDPSSILAIVGTEDPYTPPTAVERLLEVGVRVARYEGAEHGFVHDPSRPAHRADDAADAWARAFAHLDGEIVPSPAA